MFKEVLVALEIVQLEEQLLAGHLLVGRHQVESQLVVHRLEQGQKEINEY